MTAFYQLHAVDALSTRPVVAPCQKSFEIWHTVVVTTKPFDFHRDRVQKNSSPKSKVRKVVGAGVFETPPNRTASPKSIPFCQSV
jgi:hypothetical protein